MTAPSPSQIEFDPLTIRTDPSPIYRRLRDEAPAA